MAVKHLIGLNFTSENDIQTILNTAFDLKNHYGAALNTVPKSLSDKNLVLAFFENSTRTRMSFELALKHLGAGTLGFTSDSSSIKKGETFTDTLKTFESMAVDGVIIRHPQSGAAQTISSLINKPVINAGDGLHEHPTQALLDMFTLRECFGGLNGLRILILGDILHSRVARSNIFGLQKMGAHVSLCAPITLLPAGLNRMNVSLYTNLDRALEDVDAVIVLRLQLEREAGGFIPSIDDYSRHYKLSEHHLDKLSKKVFILHPGPLNREIELTNAIADNPFSDSRFQSMILNQVTNGIIVRMASLQYIFC